MARVKRSFINAVVGALSAMLPGKKAEGINTLAGNDKNFHGGQNFSAWWLSLKGVPGKVHPGMTVLPQWSWPDKAKYGQAKDGSIRHATPQIPFRVRRWRKRAAAKIAKQQGHTLAYAKEIVSNIERGIVRGIVEKKA